MRLVKLGTDQELKEMLENIKASVFQAQRSEKSGEWKEKFKEKYKET